jgi:hypothetical protein
LFAAPAVAAESRGLGPASRSTPNSPSAAGSAAPNPRFTGTPFLRTWAAEDYGAPPGNQCVLQHPGNGFIYVGNNAGVLEFDGSRWRLIRIAPPLRPTVRALVVDGRGRLWAANDDSLCCLVPDARGELQAQSAQNRLPEAERDFRTAFAMVAGGGGNPRWHDRGRAMISAAGQRRPPATGQPLRRGQLHCPARNFHRSQRPARSVSSSLSV